MFLDLCNRYYDAILEALEVEWADVVAHIGVYRRFLPDTHQLMVCAQSLIDCREEEVAQACAASGKIIEVNTSGLDAPGQVTMPSASFLRKYAKHGGDKLCLSSDAHDVARANSGFAQTAASLKALGFDKLSLPWDRGKTIAL
jgi:histidinol-phosphatase (PHP family)